MGIQKLSTHHHFILTWKSWEYQENTLTRCVNFKTCNLKNIYAHTYLFYEMYNLFPSFKILTKPCLSLGIHTSCAYLEVTANSAFLNSQNVYTYIFITNNKRKKRKKEIGAENGDINIKPFKKEATDSYMKYDCISS